MFFVYVYCHPVTNTPFYVGKGTGDRDWYHWWNKNHHYNAEMGKILREIHDLQQQPIINRVLCTDDELVAYDTERSMILNYGRLDLGTGTLCNKTPGGEGFGNTGTAWSSDQRMKRHQRYIDNSPGTGFVCYDMSGSWLYDYHNTRELKEAGYTTTQIMAIRRCCKGQRYSVADHRWSYINQPLPTATTNMKRIRQLTKTGDIVGEFVSVAEASRLLGINQGDIAGVARGNSKSKTAGGFVWKYLPN